MNLIVETDLGRDPDDFFAILWLLSIGVNIRCITITPGHSDQIAVAQLIRKELGLEFTIGAHKWKSDKRSSGGMHYKMLEKYGYKPDDESLRWPCTDGNSSVLITSALKQYPDCELFIIGPASNIHSYLKTEPNHKFKRATMQGGFCGYNFYRPSI